jgi:hypothetical protein
VLDCPEVLLWSKEEISICSVSTNALLGLETSRMTSI